MTCNRKPLYETCGGYHTDSNFDVMQLTKTAVNKIARAKYKRLKWSGSKGWVVLDKITHWAISIY